MGSRAAQNDDELALNRPIFSDVSLCDGVVSLRPLAVTDVQAVVAGASDVETQRWLPLPNPYTLDDALRFCGDFSAQVRESGRGIVRAIEFDGQFAGCIDLKRTDWIALATEIGYWASPWVRGRGVMTRAVKILAQWVILEQGFHRVEIRVAPENVASRRVAEKAGFVFEGVARDAGFIHGGRVDLAIYSLVKADLSRARQ